jgi:copper binding plastocyanin/azurin family protein
MRIACGALIGTVAASFQAATAAAPVQFLDGGLPRDPLVMQLGEAVTFTLTGPGLYHYQCHLHPQNMRGSVTVTP